MHIGLALSVLTLGTTAAYGQITAVNGASFQPGESVAPGSFATIFGRDLCSSTAVGEWKNGQLPTQLSACSVSVDGAATMLAFVSPAQINFIVPVAAHLGRAAITVADGSRTAAGSMVIGRAGPGIFSLNGMGVGEGAILHATRWTAGPFSVTTNGQPTPLAVFLTGLDSGVTPVVTIGGIPAEVVFFGTAPGYTGLQQINILLPTALAGAGRVPVVVTSAGKASNAIFIHILPTTPMMNGMPGWIPGEEVTENGKRGRETTGMALNTGNHTVLVTDEDQDVVRVISLDTRAVVATIALPNASGTHQVAVNAPGTLAAAVLSEKGAVALIDLTANKILSTIPAGSYPSHAVFSGANLLVSDAAGGTVVVIDTATRAVVRTVPVGFGPAGIAASATQAVIAGMQSGSATLLDLATWAATLVPLPDGARPHEVAIAGGKAILTTPMSNSVLLLDLATRQFRQVDTGIFNAMGPGAIAVKDNLAFIANQTGASITVVDVAAGAPVKTFAVDPGPVAVAVDAARNILLVLCEGTGTIDVVDLATNAVMVRLNAGATANPSPWVLPVVTSMTPAGAAAGVTISLVLTGAHLQSVKDVDFQLMTPGNGKALGRRGEDTDLKVSKVQVNQAGTQVTAVVEVDKSAHPGPRQVRLQADQGEIPVPGLIFTVAK